jgi:hypothetical protein
LQALAKSAGPKLTMQGRSGRDDGNANVRRKGAKSTPELVTRSVKSVQSGPAKVPSKGKLSLNALISF